MLRSYLPFLLGALLSAVSCNPGNYELASCNPGVDTLSRDACNALNDKNTDCTSMYQCDKATSSCKLSPRDYDRDGDPDVACGGTDCNDYDPKVSGANKLCSCDPIKVGQTCVVGVGACQATDKYTCKSGVLYCTVPNPPPVADPGYMQNAYTGNGSWDWNCDGLQDMKCGDDKGNLSSCPVPNCENSPFKAGMTQADLDTACNSYCTKLPGNASGCLDRVVFCDSSCGMPVYSCHCKLTGLLSNMCTGNATTTTSTVRCR